MKKIASFILGILLIPIFVYADLGGDNIGGGEVIVGWREQASSDVVRARTIITDVGTITDNQDGSINYYPASSDLVKASFVRTNNSSAFNNYVFPNADGANGQTLSTNGAGTLSWAATGAGDVTSVGDCLTGACFDGATGNTITFKGATSGTIALKPTATAGTNTLTLPAETGTACTTGSVCSGYQASGTYVTSVTGTSPIASSGGTTPAISIVNAAADGSTKGAASFTAADFDATSGNIAIDYTNGQSSNSTTKGFLTSTDWTTFNNKQGALTNSAGLAAALSDETGTGLAVFGTSPTFTTSIIIPQGANPTVNTAGNIAIDTTDDQFAYYGGAKRIIPYTYTMSKSIENITASDDNIPLWTPNYNITITRVYGIINSGTNATIFLTDGTNPLNTIIATTSGAEVTSLSNNTFVADETVKLSTTSVSGTVNWTCITWDYTVDAQ